MKNYSAKTAAEYIKGEAKGAQSTLVEIRAAVKSAVPNAEEVIAWGMPCYKSDGYLVGFCAATKHAIFGLIHQLELSDREALEKKGYKAGSKSFQIKFNQKVPVAMIKKITKAYAKKNSAKAKGKKIAK